MTPTTWPRRSGREITCHHVESPCSLPAIAAARRLRVVAVLAARTGSLAVRHSLGDDAIPARSRRRPRAMRYCSASARGHVGKTQRQRDRLTHLKARLAAERRRELDEPVFATASQGLDRTSPEVMTNGGALDHRRASQFQRRDGRSGNDDVYRQAWILSAQLGGDLNCVAISHVLQLRDPVWDDAPSTRCAPGHASTCVRDALRPRHAIDARSQTSATTRNRGAMERRGALLRERIQMSPRFRFTVPRLEKTMFQLCARPVRDKFSLLVFSRRECKSTRIDGRCLASGVFPARRRPVPATPPAP